MHSRTLFSESGVKLFALSGLPEGRKLIDSNPAKAIRLALFVVASGVLMVEGQDRQVNVTYTFDKPQTQVQENQYTLLSVKGCAALHTIGQPEVPYRTGRILLPPAATVKQVDAELLAASQTIDVSKPLTFGRTPVPIGEQSHPSVARAALDAPDQKIYGADVPYPSTRAELVSVQKMKGYSVAIVRVFPIQYRPAGGKLLFCPQIRVTLTLDAAPVQLNAVPMLRANENQVTQVKAFVDNPESVKLYDACVANSVSPLAVFDYLLVTKAALTNAFQPLVAQKIADGLTVKVATIENIVAGTAGVDDAEKVRTFITYAYTNWNTQYVLLGGDISTVPYRKAYAYCGEADADMPSDLYFACLDGSWNSDGDGYWGEPTDGAGGADVDLLAEVYVGRAPVDTASEVSNFVAKTVSYEQNGHANSGNARFLGEFLGNYSGVNAHGGDGLDTLLPSFSDYDVSWLDDRPSNSETWGAVECLDKLNESPHLVAHFGHANETYALRMYESDIGGLGNTEPFLLHSAGCYCGAFDYSDCFAEQMVKGSECGAFAVIMNSRYGWFNASEEWLFTGEFMACFFNELLVQGNRNVGEACQLSKQDMIGSVETSGDMVYRWCYFETTLFGDPHAPLVENDLLRVTPAAGLDASGPVGGPFEPSSVVYTVTNASDSAVIWAASVDSGWVTLSNSGGTLPAGGAETVAVSLAAGVSSFPLGHYSSTVTFSNCVTHVVRHRPVELQAGKIDYFTELFDGSSKTNDLSWQSFTFEPDGSPSYYKATRDFSDEFPVDPTGGVYLSLGDDGYAECALADGAQVSLYGTSYSSFYVGANGYITFGSGDSTYSPSLSAHFSLPRISALFYDLYPDSATVSWRQLTDRAVITYANVPDLREGLLNNVQVELFFNGWIRITYLDVGISGGLVGFSAGNGLPDYFEESDFSAYPPDDPMAVFPSSAFSSVGYGGGPFSPAECVYEVCNYGTNTLHWEVSKTAAWLSLSSSGGTLATGAVELVTVTLNANAGSLAPGAYQDSLVFANQVSGRTKSRSALLTIQGDLSFSSGSYSITEAGGVQKTIAVLRHAHTNVTATVDFAASPGTATAGADFVTTNGTLSFAAGETRKTFTVGVLDDPSVEPGETVLLTLSNPTGGCTLGDPASAVLTLTDDDAGDCFEPIAMFANSSYVDTGSESSGEVTNLIAALSAKQYSVRPFTDLSASGFSSALAGARMLYFPELENGSLAAALTADAKTVISNYVASGGGLIIHGSYYDYDEALLNQVFGYALNAGAVMPGETVLSAAAAGTVFAGGPSPIGNNDGTYTWLKTSLPAAAASIYEDSVATNTSVALITHGVGRIVFLAYDWYDAVPHGSQDNGWDEVLGRAVEAVASAVDSLSLLPLSGLVSSGYQGGAFSPSYKVYMLTNASASGLTWTSSNPGWITVSPASGTLAAGASVPVTVSVNANANALTPGTYADTVVISNTVSGGALSRGVSLSVLEIPGEISVSDSIAPVSDLNMPYGKTIVGLARTEHVTVNNLDSVYGLTLSEIKVRRTPSSSGVRLPRLTGPVGDVTKTVAVCGRAPRVRPAAAFAGEKLSAPSDVPCFGIEMLGQQLVSYRTADPGALTVIAGSGGDLMVGVEFLNGDFTKLYALDYDVNEFVWFDTASGVKTVVGQAAPLSGHSWTGQAGDPGGLLYACSTDGSVSMLYTIDPETATVTEVGSITGCPLIIDIAINAAGEMYGVDIALDSLVRIDKTTGAATVVGSLGVDSNYAQGLDFDEENDVLYWAAFTTQAELRVIDTATGNSALVAAFPSSTELNIAVANGGVGCFEVQNAPSLPLRIQPGGNVTFDVTYRPVKVGADEAFLVIASNDADDPQVTVALSGEGIPDYLAVSPAAGLSGSGHPGGPFTPSSQVYVVSNNSAVGISWSAANHPAWVSVSPESGALASGASASVTVAYNASAAALAEGSYEGLLVFSNVTTTVSQTRPLALEVFTTPDVLLAPAAITVTNRMGQVQMKPLQIGNAAWADANLSFSLGASEVSRNVLSAAASEQHDFTQLAKDARYRAGEMLVRFSEDAAQAGAAQEQVLAQAGGGTVTRQFKLVPGLALVKLPEGVALADALVRFNQTAGIRYAQPNYEQHAIRTPNDPFYSALWGMDNTGNVDIDAPEAWESGVGGPAVTVAVIDTGADYAHEDLAANMWRNPGEIPGNGIDDDGNGYIDDIHGYDFCNGDADPMDDNDHGTHCSGTIGAVGDNEIGVAGVCWNVKIMAMKFLDASGSGYTADAISCIDYAVQKGARVLSNSWGGGGYEQALKDAIDAAGAANVLFVAAAGNDYGNNNDSSPVYPASYASDNIISVMSVASSGAMSYFSNYGATSVDLAAPGSDILSCQPGGGYQYMSGTSMATPHVSGACALLLSLNSAATYQQVKSALIETTDASLPGLCVAGGLMRLGAAVSHTPAWLSVKPVSGSGIVPGAWSNITVTVDAGTLTAGIYAGLIGVSCNDRDTPVTNVPVTMIVIGDNLKILPTSDWIADGYTGGPFTPNAMIYTLTNAGVASLSWTACGAATPWVSVSPASGVLAGGGSVQVTAAFNSQTETLPWGDYAGRLVFSNATSMAVQSRRVALSIQERVLDHFDWSRIAPTQYIGKAFDVTVTARDGGGGLFTNYSGVASLEGLWGGGSVDANILGGAAAYGVGDVGASTFTLGYAFTPTNDLTVTHVRHYFGSKVSIWTDGGVLVASQMVSSVNGVWLETPLAEPVRLNAGSTYRVGVCFMSNYYYHVSLPFTFRDGAINASYQGVGDGFPTYADSTRWWFVDLRYTQGTGGPVAITPSESGAFVDGVWQGQVTVLEGATNVQLRVNDGGGHTGLSPLFDVVEHRIGIAEAVDSEALIWTTGGTTSWVGQAAVSHDGVDAARSGTVGNRQASWMSTEVAGPGDASFWWRVSSEADWDWLEFYVDDVLVDRLTGESGWVQKVQTLSSGAHTLKWRYVKDAADIDPVGQDCGWVDQFVAPSQSVLPLDWLLLYGLPTDGSADYADTDGDGMNNWQEWFSGTVPTNRLSLLRVESVTRESGSGYRVRWQSVAGKYYWLGSCDAMTNPPVFTPFVSNVLGEAGNTEVLDARPVNGKRFYRVGVQEE